MVKKSEVTGGRTTDLGGAQWRFGSVPRRPLDSPANDRSDVEEWLPATVPGNVRSDLLALGKIEDPFFGTNNEASQWVDDLDWWYARPLDLELRAGERAFLSFEGIDYISAVCLDEVELAHHEGMFSRQVYEITDLARSGTAELAVRVWGSSSLPQRRLAWWERLWSPLAKALQRGQEAFPQRSGTLKCQMSFGWDFAPRLRAMGLWDDVTLVVTRSVFIRDIFISAHPEGQQSGVSVQATIDSDCDQAVMAKIEVTPPGNSGSCIQTWEFALSLSAGVQDVYLEFILRDARPWQPWDRGEPNLYDFQLSITQSDQLLDTKADRFGMRTVQMSARAGMGDEAWPLIINGSAEFIRGANWVPLDALPGRLRRADYEKVISLAREAGINMLRVWGGGLREKKAFYDLCDEQGIMVWQEFPLACLLTGHLPRSTRFRGLLRREATAIVRQLRNHPSLVLWCGGNEFSYRRNRTLVDSLEEMVNTEDGTRPFRRTSPGDGDSHHWLVWHGKAPLREFRRERSPLVSEFGLQSPPDTSSLLRFLPKEHLFPPGDAWSYHCAQLEKLYRYIEGPSPRTVEEWVEASQKAQAYGLQVAIEHFRRRKYRTGGCLLWQLNDAWPAISWSIIDYYGQPKQAWHSLKSLYNPILISLEYPLRRYRRGDLLRARVWAINNLLSAWPDCHLEVSLDGKQALSRLVSLPPDSCEPVGWLELSLDQEPGRLSAVLKHGDHVISSNQYELTHDDPGRTPLLSRIYHKFGQWLLR